MPSCLGLTGFEIHPTANCPVALCRSSKVNTVWLPIQPCWPLVFAAQLHANELQ